MVRRKAETFEPVTMDRIRGHGCRDLLVYCNSGCCHHSATMNADWMSDETPARSLRRRMVCTKCGMIKRRRSPRLESARQQAVIISAGFRSGCAIQGGQLPE